MSVIRTDTNEVVETILCRPVGRLPFGSGSNALALTSDGTTLYVANGTMNAIAVLHFEPEDRGDSHLLGFVPVGAAEIHGGKKTVTYLERLL